ncbi:MAG TPA: hypothetical protein VHN12_00255 [Geobacteraceae bacterium]|nr:hypothetical protein [Geobacteraceae bacterium]
MKHFLLSLLFLLLSVAGCEYQEPLYEKQNISIDQALLGLWEPAPEKNEPKPSGEWILALKYSDTEYLIHYHTGSDSMYFRAYPLKVGDISCLQLQLIGNDSGPLAKTDPAWQVAFVTRTGDEVTIRMMNTSVVGRDLRGPGLREAFLKNSKNTNFFREPVKFRRVTKR